MIKPHNVAVLVGSLRRDSVNRKVSGALIELAPSTLKLSLIEIGGFLFTTRMTRLIRTLLGRSFATVSMPSMVFCSSPRSITDQFLPR
jgi:hypothetical protein